MQPYRLWFTQELIEKNKRLFRIPVYQRNYDWGPTQCLKLYRDIVDAYKNDRKHFTGVIVYIKGLIQSSSLDECFVIDGQQRLITMFLLLRVLYDIAISTDNSVQSELQDLLFNRNCEEEQKLKLKTIRSESKTFNNIMRGIKSDYGSKSNITRNYEYLKKQVSADLAKGLELRDILRGMKWLEIIEVILDPSQGDDPQAIFESINSTGLELSLADLIRNFILMSNPDQEMLFNDYWYPIEQEIGNDELPNFFIHFLTYKSTSQITKSNAYDEFKKLFFEKEYTHKSLLIELKRVGKYFSAFIGNHNGFSNKINCCLESFRLLDQTTLYPFLFQVFEDLHFGKIDTATVENILELLRSYSVRRLICEIPSNSLKGLYKTLYSRLKNQEAYDADLYTLLYSFLHTTMTKDRIPSDKDFKSSLIEKNLYGKKKVCKYLLSQIENEHANEKLRTESLTIEHILPRSQNSPVWKKELGQEYDNVYNKYLDTLGNLTITGHNSELGTKSFNEKKKIIEEKSKAVRLNRSILDQYVWDETAILRRAEILSNFILNLMVYPSATIIQTSSYSNTQNAISLSDLDEVTGQKPNTYTLLGETVQVDTWRDILKNIISTLYSLEPNTIISLASKHETFGSAGRHYLSFIKTSLRAPKELEETGIYYETNLSAISILNFIKNLIERCGLEIEDFHFTLQ